ncbi:MAG: thioredoxin [Rhodanobacteraceae bacterium]|nr:MAG: thioredoxin [Rhodanobacteraceae bacterium]
MTNPAPATNAAAPPLVFEAGEATFETAVLQASMQTPVLVDFWATWCGPCKALSPILDKLAEDYAGAFRLAKVDCDKEQQLAGMFGVRSIPTVVLIQGGQIVDAFSGALPESEVRQFLERHQIKPATRIEAPADAIDDATPAAVETPQAAVARLQKAVDADPGNTGLQLDLALAKARSGDTASAQATLDALPVNLAEDDRAKALAALLSLQQSLAAVPPAAELLARVERDPRDFAARDGIAVRQLLGGNAAEALQQWLAILGSSRDWNDGLARKRLLDAFRIIDDDALVTHARQQMASLLF